MNRLIIPAVAACLLIGGAGCGQKAKTQDEPGKTPAEQLKEKLSRLSQKQKALCEETLRQDIELLEGGVALPAADRYAADRHARGSAKATSEFKSSDLSVGLHAVDYYVYRLRRLII